jgi:hypothetical protein
MTLTDKEKEFVRNNIGNTTMNDIVIYIMLSRLLDFDNYAEPNANDILNLHNSIKKEAQEEWRKI